MKKLYLIVILLVLLSCSQIYEDEYIYIPELEKKINNELNFINKLKFINNWVMDNIKFKLSLLKNKTAIQTFKDKEGECRDQLALMLYLADQYFDIKFEILLIINRRNLSWHYVAYNKKYDFYFMIKKGNPDYFLNSQLWILRRMSYQIFLNECN